MADKKTKNAPEVKTLEQLKEDLATKQRDLLEAKRSNAAGELVNPRVITSTKKDIARLLTAINAAEREQKESK
ncbi:MAG TPA: 50S ribosomal protein L29 [Candidatus Saccharimonadales bacterium]|nr:50S ribosomal protein L29 [Candidatus Saccharimonadales bacterium]